MILSYIGYKEQGHLQQAGFGGGMASGCALSISITFNSSFFIVRSLQSRMGLCYSPGTTITLITMTLTQIMMIRTIDNGEDPSCEYVYISNLSTAPLKKSLLFFLFISFMFAI